MKTTFNTVILAFICLFQFSVKAQNLTLKTGSESLKRDKHANLVGPYQFASSEDGIYTYSATPHESGSLIIYPSKITLSHFDSKMGLEKENELSLKYGKLKLQVLDILEFNGTQQLISVIRDRKTQKVTLYHQKLNLSDLSLSDPEEFFEYEVDLGNYMTLAHIEIKVSDNSNYFMVSANPENSVYIKNYYVFDSNFEKVSETSDNALVEEEKDVLTKNAFITNTGNAVFITQAITYEKNSKGQITGMAEYKENYVVHMKKDGSLNETLLPKSSAHVGFFTMKENQEGNFLFMGVSGAYSPLTVLAKKKGEPAPQDQATPSKVSTFVLSKDNLNTLAEHTEELPNGFTAKPKLSDKQQKDEEKIEKMKKSRLQETIQLNAYATKNETFVFLAQKFSVYNTATNASGTDWDFYLNADNMMACNVDQQGAIKWTVGLPKCQRVIDKNEQLPYDRTILEYYYLYNDLGETTGSIVDVTENGDIQIFYNDTPENSKVLEDGGSYSWSNKDKVKGISMVSIDPNGSLKKDFVSISEKEDYVLGINFKKKTEENSIQIFLLEKKKYHIGELTF